MSTKITNMKRATPGTQFTALISFREVTEEPHHLSYEESARYTIWRIHRYNMGSRYPHRMTKQTVDGPSLLRNYKGWQSGAVHEHAEQVFKNLFVYPLGFNTLKGYYQEASFQRIVENGVWHRSARGAIRFCGVTGLCPEQLMKESVEDMQISSLSRGYTLLDSGRLWAKILKGRDLFIPGLGGFDIQKVANNLVYVLGFRSGTIPSPAQFAACGYSLRKTGYHYEGGRIVYWQRAYQLACMIASGNQHINSWGRRWYLKDYDVLMQHMGMVADELNFLRGPQVQEVIPNLLVHPRTVRENLERVRLRVRQESTGFPLNMKYDNHSIPEIAYTIDGKLLKLRPVVDFTELSGIAKQFGNCAANYHDSILSGESVVVPVINDKEEVIALAEIGPAGDVRQLEGPHHAEIEDASISSCVDKYATVVAASTIKDMTDSVEE